MHENNKTNPEVNPVNFRNGNEVHIFEINFYCFRWRSKQGFSLQNKKSKS